MNEGSRTVIAVVTGSRLLGPEQAAQAWERFCRVLEGPPGLLIHGDCAGADRLLADLAREAGSSLLGFPALPELYGPWPACGPKRNRAMVTYAVHYGRDTGRPVRGLALPRGARETSRGTWGAMELLAAAQVPMLVIPFPVKEAECV